MNWLIVTGDDFGMSRGINRGIVQAHRDGILTTASLLVVTELTCHPGYVEPGFRSSYAAERETELRTLCDDRVHQAILDKGIRLVGFRDLPGAVALSEHISEQLRG